MSLLMFVGDDVEMVNWKFFIGACILSCGLLFKIGAPILPAVGRGRRGRRFLNWRRHRSSR